jgi:hypothetical protein
MQKTRCDQGPAKLLLAEPSAWTSDEIDEIFEQSGASGILDDLRIVDCGF